MIQKCLLFISILLMGGALTAQDIAIRYTTVTGQPGTDTVLVYMRTYTENTMDISAVNFSFAYQNSCASFQEVSYSLFTDNWTSFLEASTVQTISEAYGGFFVDRRYRYGNANPGLPFSNPVTIPSKNQPPMLVMKLVFSGPCSRVVYMENEGENPVNQIAVTLNFLRAPYTITPFGNVFPVEILSFTHDIIDHETVQLEWKTSNESNNDYFQVEKSLDGVTFNSIPNAILTGAGTTQTETKYEYQDHGQMANVVYYRLKQVDFDGAFLYSNIVESHFGNLNPSLDMTVTAFPNPTTKWLNVEIDAFQNTTYEIKLVDIQGRVVHTQEALFGPAYPQAQKLLMDSYKQGIYFLVVEETQESGDAFTLRILKN